MVGRVAERSSILPPHCLFRPFFNAKWGWGRGLYSGLWVEEEISRLGSSLARKGLWALRKKRLQVGPASLGGRGWAPTPAKLTATVF